MMKLFKYNEITRKGEPLSAIEKSNAYKFAHQFDEWQLEEDKAFDYIEKHGADKFHDTGRCKRLDKSRDAFLKIYNKVFNENLRPDYDFHLVKELESKSYRDAVLID